MTKESKKTTKIITVHFCKTSVSFSFQFNQDTNSLFISFFSLFSFSLKSPIFIFRSSFDFSGKLEVEQKSRRQEKQSSDPFVKKVGLLKQRLFPLSQCCCCRCCCCSLDVNTFFSEWIFLESPQQLFLDKKLHFQSEIVVVGQPSAALGHVRRGTLWPLRGRNHFS